MGAAQQEPAHGSKWNRPWWSWYPWFSHLVLWSACAATVRASRRPKLKVAGFPFPRNGPAPSILCYQCGEVDRGGALIGQGGGGGG